MHTYGSGSCQQQICHGWVSVDSKNRKRKKPENEGETEEKRSCSSKNPSYGVEVKSLDFKTQIRRQERQKKRSFSALEKIKHCNGNHRLLRQLKCHNNSVVSCNHTSNWEEGVYTPEHLSAQQALLDQVNPGREEKRKRDFSNRLRI